MILNLDIKKNTTYVNSDYEFDSTFNSKLPPLIFANPKFANLSARVLLLYIYVVASFRIPMALT